MAKKHDRDPARNERVIDDYRLTVGESRPDLQIGQDARMNIGFGRDGADLLTGGADG